MSRADVRRRMTEMAADAETDWDRRQIEQRIKRMDEQAARVSEAAADHRQLVDGLEGAARRVAELHAPTDDDPVGVSCSGCDFAGWECERPEWPCRTIGALR